LIFGIWIISDKYSEVPGQVSWLRQIEFNFATSRLRVKHRNWEVVGWGELANPNNIKSSLRLGASASEFESNKKPAEAGFLFLCREAY
jgi:hypothetical protein